MKPNDRRLLITVALLVGFSTLPYGATAGNGTYVVNVVDANSGVGVGVYTATTDVLHPVTLAYGPQNVLFGGNAPSSSWSTIHSFTSDTTYTQRKGQSIVGSSPTPFILEDFVVPGQAATPVGTTGFQTHYMIVNQGSGNGPDDSLDVFQTVRAVGTNFNDSAVELTTQVFNVGNHTTQIGVRYFLDFEIGGGEDGPAFQLKGPNGPVQVLEQNLPVPPALTFEVQDNNDPNDPICQFGAFNTPFPFFTVGGSVRGPSRFLPTAPTLLQFVAWPLVSGLPGKSAFFAAQDAFFYSPAPVDAATCVTSYDDSGANYFWGESAGNAITLAPGQGASVSAYLFAFLPGQSPSFPPGIVEICNDGIDNDGDGKIDAADGDCGPLSVTLASFDARPGRRGVSLTWATGSEPDNAGFLVMRSSSPNGPFAQATPFMIPARGSDVSGASYSFEDRAVSRKRLYYYKLVDVDLSGNRTEHGPLAASLGDPKPERRKR
ncbi:MAG: hypothetical protein HY049_07325 [Acidobacteria bacterium]|nr:hypothetical protein [Acidobacteriota bacterium]